MTEQSRYEFDNRFILRWTNFDFPPLNDRFPTRDAAIAAGRKAGFEFTVHEQNFGANTGTSSKFRMVASWSVFGGLRSR